MDPYKATPAALAYLSDLYDMFDDWFLALAAYNCGEMRVLRRLIAQELVISGDFVVFLGRPETMSLSFLQCSISL